MSRRPETPARRRAPHRGLEAGTRDRPPQDTAPPGLAASVGPDAVEVFPRMLRVGSGWTTTLVVTGYPAEVGLAWLDVVLRGSVRLDVAVHVEPLPPATAAAGLRKARARLEASRRLDADKGRLGDPLTDVAAEDAADLADRLGPGRVSDDLCNGVLI
jgi:hypothetical protein